MKLSDVINFVDKIKPNAFDVETKIVWINEVEGLLQTEVMLLSSSDITRYTDEDLSAELLAKPPHDKIYWSYLSAMIDFAHGEYNKYQNSMQLFNSYFGEYMRWYATWYHPADGGMIAEGYYISAYSIAVKHGFVGTEQEWLDSLNGKPGGPGPAGKDGEDGRDGRDGADGEDGISPVIVVEDITGGHRVTLYDAAHPSGQSFNVLNGEGTSEQRVGELINAHNSSSLSHPGKADLVDGKVPSSQLPSYVDDVVEYSSSALFPAVGESGKIYIATDTNKTYRWGGSEYVEITSSLALGETSSTAYRGDRGAAAYAHSMNTNNPHSVTYNQVGADAAGHTTFENEDGTATVVKAFRYTSNPDDVGVPGYITFIIED